MVKGRPLGRKLSTLGLNALWTCIEWVPISLKPVTLMLVAALDVKGMIDAHEGEGKGGAGFGYDR